MFGFTDLYYGAAQSDICGVTVKSATLYGTTTTTGVYLKSCQETSNLG